MQSMRILGWVSIFMALAIMGMGGAPIAEKLGIEWLRLALLGCAYASVAVLILAAFLVGGMGLYHGILVILGREVGTIRPKAPDKPMTAPPQVEPSQGER